MECDEYNAFRHERPSILSGICSDMNKLMLPKVKQHERNKTPQIPTPFDQGKSTFRSKLRSKLGKNLSSATQGRCSPKLSSYTVANKGLLQSKDAPVSEEDPHQRDFEMVRRFVDQKQRKSEMKNNNFSFDTVPNA